MLRISVKVPASEAEASLPDVRRLELVAPTLPVPAHLKRSRASGQFVAVDLEASLYLVLGDDADPQAQGERLLAEVGPSAQALSRRC